MKIPRLAALCLLLPAVAPAHAQERPQQQTQEKNQGRVQGRVQGDRPDAGAIRSSVTDILAMATFGLVAIQDQAAELSRSGADYLVRLPIKEISVPADAAVQALVRPIGDGQADSLRGGQAGSLRDGQADGLWDIVSATLPPVGTIGRATFRAGANPITYSLGKQAIHGQIDPSFAQLSHFAAGLDDVELRSDQGNRRSELALDRYDVTGTTVADAIGQLNFTARDQATNGRFINHAPDGTGVRTTVQAVSGHLTIEGLDRAKGTRLARLLRVLMTGSPPPAAEHRHGGSAAGPPEPATLADAASGLLTSLETEQKLTDIHFSVAPANSGSIGRIGLNMTVHAANNRLDGRADIAMDKLSWSVVPPGTGPYVPQRVDVVSVMADVPPGPLVALLQAAMARDADPVSLLARSATLFGDPNTRIGIESFRFSSGPLRVTGSAWLRPRASGQVGIDIHLSAAGLDALIAQAQTTPALRQALPAILLANGIGHQDGDAVVWDISLGGGPLIVNGIPLGQAPTLRR